MGESVGVLGARSLLGECLLPLLTQQGRQVLAFSRQKGSSDERGVEWQPLTAIEALEAAQKLPQKEIHNWISLIPIWALPEHFSLIGSYNPKRVVALSSTSRFTKTASSDPTERAISRRLFEGERLLSLWARERRLETIVLRPTLIYGYGRDRNVSQIARFINKFGFFPVCGAADGLRQPVHAEDVAMACLGALGATHCNSYYNLSGGETLTYRSMVNRIFTAAGRRPVILTLSPWVFRIAAICLHGLPQFQNWSIAMVERMNRDLVFDHSKAEFDLGFCPRKFRPDVPL